MKSYADKESEIKRELSRVSRGKKPKGRAFKITNIAWKARAPDVTEFLGTFGKVSYLKLPRDPNGRGHCGYAVVKFTICPELVFDDRSTYYDQAREFMGRRVKWVPISEDSVEAESTPKEGPSEDMLPATSIRMGSAIDDNDLFSPSVISHPVEIAYPRGLSLQFIIKKSESETFLLKLSLNIDTTLFVFNQDNPEEEQYMTVYCEEPARLYESSQKVSQKHGIWNYRKDLDSVWIRTAKLRGFDDFDVGTHNMYHFALETGNLPDKFIESLQTFKIKYVIRPDPWNLLEKLPESLVDVVKLDGLDFDVHYKILAAVSTGVFGRWRIKTDFLDLILDSENEALNKALDFLITRGTSVDDPTEAVKELIEVPPAYTRTIMSRSFDGDLFVVRKAFVTPSSVVFCAPVAEVGNRVVRNFREHIDRFLRISMVDENLAKFHTEGKDSEDIFRRYREFLDAGIQIGDRKYEFLAFSSSQLRTGSCWFFANLYDDDGKLVIGCDDIRKWMGNFEGIKSVGKYAARLGQCFASSRSFRVESQPYGEIPDVERNGYCFSDGIGRISLKLAKELGESMRLQDTPSAFQVRMNGYKGVLSVDPRIKDDEHQLQFRPSMRKFETNETSSLDILSYTQYAPAYLNHQIITLLNSMGVSDDTFVKMKDKMIDYLDNLKRSDIEGIAVLNSYSAEHPILATVAEFLRSDINADERFMQGILKLFRCYKLKEIQLKARILVDSGTQLMGVLDETNTLKYGQIFVQYSDPKNDDEPTIVKGRVLMAKMPAVHPGDIRVLTCVDRPELHFYKDVVVFPQDGERPHTFEASGSDLDGDIYFVTWDRRLIPPFRNFTPMEYDSEVPPVREEGVTMEDVKDFMVQYLAQDMLGVIANLHKIHADMSAKGVHSEICRELAHLHSVAVDFPKSGIPADFDLQKYRVDAYPDFLSHPRKKKYKSNKALGKLYRSIQVEKFEIHFESIRADPIFMVGGYEHYVDEAEEIGHSYNWEIRRLMAAFEVDSEIELVSQLFLDSVDKGWKKNYELKKSASGIMARVKAEYLKQFWEDIEDGENHLYYHHSRQFPEAALKKASAWYWVAYERNLQSIVKTPDGKSIRLLSFPWVVVGDILITIRDRSGWN